MNENSQNNGHVEQNGYYEEYRSLNWSDYMRILRRRWWLLLLCLLGVLAPTAYYTFTTPPVYETSTTIMVQDGGNVQQVLFDQGGFLGRTSNISDQVYLLKSRSIADLVVEKLMQSQVRDSLQILRQGFALAVQTLRQNLTAEPVKNTNFFIKIAVRGASPFEAAYLANTIASVYQNQDQQSSQGEIREVVEFLDQQLQKKEKDLKVSEENLKNYQERVNITSLSGAAMETVNQLAQFEALHHSALTDLQGYRKRLEFLNQQLGREKATLTSNIAQISNPLVLKLREELAEIERRASVLIAQGVSEEYSDLKRLRGKQASIKKRLIDETQLLILSGLRPGNPLTHAQDLVGRVIEAETEILSLQARADALKRVARSYARKLEKLPERSLRLARLERYKKVDENLYYMMKEKYEESRISMAGQIGKVRIIDSAVAATSPVSPKKERNLVLGTLFGLGLGVLVIMFLEFIDKSVGSIEDLERLGFALMAAIPHIPKQRGNGLQPGENRNGHTAEMQIKLIANTKPKSPVSEAYRTLRTNIQFSESAAKMKSILVTSSGPGEGKTTTVTNLGIILANMGLRTLIVDSDLRRPTLHRAFRLDKQPGLTNLLLGDGTLEMLSHATEIDNLYILTCGTIPPNPSELLGSAKMKTLLNELKNNFQMVLLDSPPVIAVTDAQVLASQTDGVLLLVKSGESQIEAVQRAKSAISQTGGRLLGVVLNDVRPQHMYGSYYYYYYHNYDEKDDERDGSERESKSRKESSGLSF